MKVELKGKRIEFLDRTKEIPCNMGAVVAFGGTNDCGRGMRLKLERHVELFLDGWYAFQ